MSWAAIAIAAGGWLVAAVLVALFIHACGWDDDESDDSDNRPIESWSDDELQRALNQNRYRETEVLLRREWHRRHDDDSRGGGPSGSA